MLATSIQLRAVETADLPIFFAYQQEPESIQMAAFTVKDPSDKAAFDTHWDKIIADDSVFIRTILYEGEVAGSVLKYEMFGEAEVSYWIGKKFWGKGVATEALRQFLQILAIRPLHARVAKDNLGSTRVLQKCGFKITGEDKGFANARGEEIEEYVLMLN